MKEKELISKLKLILTKYRVIYLSTLIIGFEFFVLFLYLAYKVQPKGEITPITLFICIGLLIISVIYFRKTLELKYELTNMIKQRENEHDYQIHKETMEIENEKFERYKELHEKKLKTSNQSTYHIKQQTITANEQYFLDIIKKHFSNNYEIRPQVPLSSIIEKNKEHDWEYQNELNRIIDFGLFDKQTTTPLLLIEINDKTHHESKRIYRDQKVKNICEQAGIKLIAFWTEYSNTEQYIVERISKELNSD